MGLSEHKAYPPTILVGKMIVIHWNWGYPVFRPSLVFHLFKSAVYVLFLICSPFFDNHNLYVIICVYLFISKAHALSLDSPFRTEARFRAISSSAVTLRHLLLQSVSMGPSAQQMLAELQLGTAVKNDKKQMKLVETCKPYGQMIFCSLVHRDLVLQCATYVKL